MEITNMLSIKKNPERPAFPKIVETFVLIILVASSYFAFGLLGLFLAVPPSNAGAIWPPAGIALAATLILGYRIWPGIFIGNFCISAWAFGFNNDAIIVYAATGMGATSNALAGRFLIQRFIGIPNRLIDERAIFRFFLLGGPISCLIPATIGISVMALVGIIRPHEIPINWVSWWVGDTIGVIVFTPLILILFGQPRSFWKQRKSSVALPLTLTFLMVVCLFVYATQLKTNKQIQYFEYTATLLNQAFNNRIQHHFHTLITIQNLFQDQSSETIKDNLFLHIAKQPMVQFEELEAISWINAIHLKPGYNRNDIFSKSRTPGKTPIFSSIDFYNDLLKKSAQTRNGRITESNIFSDFKDSNLFLYLPVFSKQPADKKNTLSYQGSVISVINLPSLLKQSFLGIRYEHINFILFESEHDSAETLFNYNFISDFQPNPSFNRSFYIPLGNRTLKMLYQVRPDYINAKENWTIWWMLISGLSFTSLLGVGLMLMTGRYFRTESIVEQRTQDLRKEIRAKEQIEADLKIAKNRAESANEAKSQFLRNMSHELRTPLNGILGFTQLLQNDSRLNSGSKEKIGIIKQCGDYLLTLINDILDISKIEADKIEIESKPFDFISFLDDMVEIFKLSAEEKNIAFTAKKHNLPQTVISDEKHLRQIIMNLLSNAIKFTDQGQVALSASYQDNTLLLEVKDTGCGIDEKDHENIFQSFVQISNPGFAAHGTGLGLAITNRLIALMGGKLALQSQPGIGSTFTLTLPLAEKNYTPRPKAKQHKIIGYQGEERHILLVDDDQTNLTFMKTLLQKLGFKVSMVRSGKECIQFCANVLPDLIFMDMLMPEMSGIKTINALYKINPTSFKIVGMSASVFTTEKQSFLDAGCFSFLPKPIEQNDLFNCLEQAIKVQWLYQSPMNQPSDPDNIRVLIADDNEINCLLLNNLLENLACNTTIVNDGKQALDLLQHRAFDLALIDLNMPVMDGIEFIQKVHRAKLLKPDMKILAISAYVDDNTISQTLTAGYDDYLKKPVDADFLKHYIQSLSALSLG